MAYKPKIVAGKVKDTGYAMDGHVIYFIMWDYDREFWRICGWDEADDYAVMETMYDIEVDDGICEFETFGAFAENWKAKKWRPRVDYAFPLDKVEVLEVKQEEEPNETREKMIAAGFELAPRRSSDFGGILLLPLDENMNGDVQAKHPDWTPTTCPICGRKCWKQKEVDHLQIEQGVKVACTACALEAELLAPFKPNNTPHPDGNREQRRRKKREQKGS